MDGTDRIQGREAAVTGWQLTAAIALVACLWCLLPDPGEARLSGLAAGASRGPRGPTGAGSRRAGNRRIRWWGTAVATSAALVSVPFPWSLPVAAALALACHVLLARMEPGSVRRRRERLLMQQPEVLDLLSASLEAGAPLRGAVRQIAEIAPEPSAQMLREVDAHVGVGFSETQAWQNLRGDAVWAEVARDLARAAMTGEAVTEILRARAEAARRARHNQLAAKARTVGVKSVGPMMVCFLPAFILVGVVPIIAGTVSRFLG